MFRNSLPMHSLKRLEKVFHAIVPRRVRYAIKDAARRAVKAVRTHARADRRPTNGTSQSVPYAGPWAAESRTAGPGVVILVADPVDRSIFAGMITDEWCRVEDPAVYVPRSEDYVYAPESVVGALSAGELRSAYFSLLHDPNDVVIISRSIESLPAVAVSSLRQSTLVCAAGHEWLLHGRPFRKPVRGRVMRLLVHRDAAVIDTSIDRLLGCRCRLVEQQFHVQGLPGHHSLPSPRHEPTVCRPPAASAGDRPTMLVLPALFAVGGVERNTVEVLAKLQDRYRFVIVTNEPHEPARGSLHRQLEGLCEAVYDLGEMADATHHADILAALHDLHRFDCAWIVNGSPRLSRNLSTVREILSDCAIVDQQVYDTVHGWISCYEDQAIKSFDRHVAINSLIADAFVNHFGIPLSPLVAEMGCGGRRRQPDRVADLLSVIEGAKAFAMLLEAYGGLGGSLWHTSYLQAVFELAMLHGFVIGQSTHGADTEAGYMRILGGFLRRVEPILATDLPGSRGLVEAIRSQLAA